MSLYGASQIRSLEDFANSNEVLEMFIIDDLMRADDATVKQFCESEEAKILVEKSVLKKPSLMRLDAAADQKRRMKLMAYQMAKDANDPEWVKLKKYTAKRKECIGKIMTKYGPRAEKAAKIAQKNYIKTAQKLPSTPEKR